MSNLQKGRVVLTHYSKYIVEENMMRYSCEVSGRFKYTSFNKSDYPVVGDFVFFRQTNPLEGIIERVEQRKSSVKRLAVSTVHNAQIVASNIDLLFICMALDYDFNLRKLRNLISMSYSTDYEIVLLLTKKDIGNFVDEKIEQVRVETSMEYRVLSAFDKEDITSLKTRIGKKTCAFIGSSGVGKSTLINKLLGYEKMETNDIRVADSQGRHTTVHRELVYLDSGGIVIDTPGIRITNSYYVDDMDIHFDDIFSISKDCKFRDCTHTYELDCAVQKALEEGTLSSTRYEQFKQVQRLNNFTVKRERQKQRIQEKKRNKRR